MIRLFIKSFVFSSLLSLAMDVLLVSPSWSSTTESDSGGWITVESKKRSGSKSSSSKNKVTSLLNKAQNLSVGTKVSQKKKKVLPPRPTTLVRPDNNNSPLVYYTNKLKLTDDKSFKLKRPSTTNSIDYVWSASQNDGGKTHLRAQGIYYNGSNNQIHPKPFTITQTQSFLDAFPISSHEKKMVWVSQGSNAVSDNNYFIRKPQTDYNGGHAEPQFIADLEAAFTQNSDAVIKYFMPLANNQDDIYMCGLELFGPYDMCDPFVTGIPNQQNRYNCVGKLLSFRQDHQSGQQSISGAIRQKLGNKFKGTEEDAFIIIYHSKYPYNNVHRYKAKDGQEFHPLNFAFYNNGNSCKFKPTDNSDYSNFTLSQHQSLAAEKDVIYGYIHHLANRTVNYTPDDGFLFP